MKHATYTPGKSEVVPVFGGQIAAIVEGPTKELLEPAIDLVGGKIATGTMQCILPRTPTSQRLQLPPPPQLKDGMEPIAAAEVVTDPANMVKRLERWEQKLDSVSEECAEGLWEFSRWTGAKRSAIKSGDEEAGREFCQRAAKLVEDHPRLSGLYDETAGPVVLLEEVEPIVQIGLNLDKNQPLAMWREYVGREGDLAEERAGIDAEALRGDLRRSVPAVNSLRAMVELAGDAMPFSRVYFTRSQREFLAKGRDRLIQDLVRQKQPYWDIALLQPITGSLAPAIALGEDLERCGPRASVWCTVGGIASEADACQFVDANPVKGTTGAGSVFSHLGDAQYKGFPVTIGALALALRYRLDAADLGGHLTSNWGPQCDRNLTGVENVSTAGWDEDTLKHLAKKGGQNCLTDYSSGVVSFYSGRTVSSLHDYRMSSANRTAAMVEGFVLQYLALNLPSQPNDDAIVRAYAERAERNYLAPFATHAAFREGRVVPIRSASSVQAKLEVVWAIKDPIEEIVLTRRNKT